MITKFSENYKQLNHFPANFKNLFKSLKKCSFELSDTPTA